MEASKGEADPEFWNSCGKIAPPLASFVYANKFNGWLINFFPYIGSKRNENLRDLEEILKQMEMLHPRNFIRNYNDEPISELEAELVYEMGQKISKQ